MMCNSRDNCGLQLKMGHSKPQGWHMQMPIQLSLLLHSYSFENNLRITILALPIAAQFAQHNSQLLFRQQL